MPLSPAVLLGMYPDMDPNKAAALSQATGYTPPPQVPSPPVPTPLAPVDRSVPEGATPAPPGVIVQSIGPRAPDATILPPSAVATPTEEPPPDTGTMVLGSVSNQQSSGTSVAGSGVSAPTRAEAQKMMRQGLESKEQGLEFQTKAAEVRAPAQLAGAEAKAAIEDQTLRDTAVAQDLAKQKVDMAKANLKQATEDVANSEVNPNRIFHDGGLGAVVIAGIAQAAGAFGAGLTHGPNTAADIIKDAIERDTRAQEANYAKKQWKAGIAKDALSEAVQQYGSIPAAMSALKVQKLAYVDSKLAIEEAKAKTYEQAQSLANTRAQIADDGKKNLLQFDKDVNDHVTRTSTGSRTMTQAEHPAPSVPTNQTVQAQVQDLSSRLEKAGIPEAKQQVQHTLKNWRVMEMDPNKPIEGLGISQDVLDALPKGVGRRFMSEAGRENRKNLEQLFLGYRHELTGAGGSDAEMDAMKTAFYGSRTAAELRDTMRAWDERIAAKEQNIRGGYSPEANALYDRRNPAFSAVPVKKK